MKTSEFGAFVKRHWFGDHYAWFAALADHQLIGVDWPPAPLSRDAQLALIDALCENLCPLMPESLSIVAPIVRSKADEALWQRTAKRLKANPLDEAIGYQLVDDSFTLLIDDERILVGAPRTAPQLIAQHFSPFCCVQELVLGIHLCSDALNYWDHSKSAQQKEEPLSELQIKVDTVRALLLRNSPIADRQIALMSGELRGETFWLLNGYLGYYSLLTPDPILNSNEPIPFQYQRQYLRHLRSATDRDQRLQRDDLFNESMNEQT